jgi:CheY-like chemotaxis protein
VSRHRVFLAAVLAVSLPALSIGQVDSEFYATPKTAQEFWRATRFEIRIGNYERAAERIKGLLDLNPDGKTLVELVDRPVAGGEGGMAPFLRLRNVPRWYPIDAADKNDRREKEARANVESLIDKISKALEAELSNPERIRRFANNLAGPEEESAFALREVRRSGKAAIPVLAQMMTEGPQAEVRGGIVNAIPELDAVTVPPLVAFIAGADTHTQADLIDALRRRADYRNTTLTADSDPVPTLWYLWGNPRTPDTVRSRAREGIISAIRVDPAATDRGAEARSAQAQLTATARRFYLNTSNLPNLAGDATDPVHNIWTWDGKALKETKLTRAAAAEHYGLRYAKWALDLQPDLTDAQVVFLGLAIESQALRTGGGGNLAKTAPELHAALATAPFEVLAALLEDALRLKKTPVILAATRILGDRTEVNAARVTTKPSAKDMRPSLLVKALDYPDSRVQFAAADALLRTPGTPTHGRAAQIVKILAGAVAADPVEGAKQKVLLADPDQVRAELVAALLRRVGFEVEFARTGRDLFRRLHTRSDTDLIMIDRHIADPMLPDLLPQLKADRRGRGLPIMLIASPDGVTPVNVFTALARLAVVVSFADLPQNPYLDYNLGRKDVVERVNRSPDETRRDILARHKAQVQRISQLVEEAGFVVAGETADRIAYLSIQTFSEEVLRAFVPQLLTEERILLEHLLPAEIRAEVSAAPASALKSRIRPDPTPPSFDAAARTIKLMRSTAILETEIPQERLVALGKTWDLFWNPEAPKLPPMEAIRNPEIEHRVAKIAAGVPNVTVIPAVFTDEGFKSTLAQAADPKTPLGTPAEKKEMAKAAMVWLRKMAVGEVTGYSVAEATPAILGALKSDDLAGLAIDAVVRIPSREAQQDLANLAVDGTRPVPLRSAAADALVTHIQSYGKFVTGPQADAVTTAAGATEDAELRARLLAAQGVLKSDLKGTADRLKGYVPKEAPPPAMPPAEEKKEEKKE